MFIIQIYRIKQIDYMFIIKKNFGTKPYGCVFAQP